jgi:hypothetical protein
LVADFFQKPEKFLSRNMSVPDAGAGNQTAALERVESVYSTSILSQAIQFGRHDIQNSKYAKNDEDEMGWNYFPGRLFRRRQWAGSTDACINAAHRGGRRPLSVLQH